MFERREDALIAYTFDQLSCESGETDWPLLLPMVKSARACDGRHPGVRGCSAGRCR